MIVVIAGITRTRGSRLWVGNLQLGCKGHVEFVFNFVPGYLGILVWINWEVRE